MEKLIYRLILTTFLLFIITEIKAQFYSFFTGTEILGTITLNTSSSIYALFTEFDTNGSFIWAKQVDDLNLSEHFEHPIKCMDNHEIIVSGSISRTAFFDSIIINSIGSQGFLEKLKKEILIGLISLKMIFNLAFSQTRQTTILQ